MLILSGCEECESGYVKADKNCLSKIVEPVSTIKPILPSETGSPSGPIQFQLREISSHRLEINPYTQKALSFGEAEIKIGSKNIDITTVQTILKTKGFYSEKITGNFDETTKNAVINFQKSRGIKSDGVVGVDTWAALKEASLIQPSQRLNVENIISKQSEWLIPNDVEFLGVKIPMLYIGASIGALIGFGIYKRIQKKKKVA